VNDKMTTESGPAWSNIFAVNAETREEANVKAAIIHDDMLSEGMHVRIYPVHLVCDEPECDGFHGQFGYLAEYWEEDQG
jgi:hypothetical protein